MTQPSDFDLIFIGGGATLEGALRGAALGLRCAVVEREQLGGTWLHSGCLPLKTLLKGAATFKQVAAAEALGVRAARPVLDYEALQRRKTLIAEELRQRLEDRLRHAGVTLFVGEGALVKAGGGAPARVGERPMITVRVRNGTDTLLQATHVVLATGSRPARPAELQPDGVRIVTTDEALALPEAPQSICIVGAGPSGCEFAAFYAALGTQVTLLEREATLLPHLDVDLGRELSTHFAAQGVVIYTNVSAVSASRNPAGLQVDYVVAGQRQSVAVEKVLLATGRVPNSDRLGLDRLGVRLDAEGFVQVDAEGRTNLPAVYAVGDVKGEPMLAHVASYEAAALAERIAGHTPAPMPRDAVAIVVDGVVQAGSVGWSEGRAREALNGQVQVQRVRTGRSPRALVDHEPSGFVKLVYGEGRLVGAHVLGQRVDDTLAFLTAAVRAQFSSEQLFAAVSPAFGSLSLMGGAGDDSR